MATDAAGNTSPAYAVDLRVFNPIDTTPPVITSPTTVDIDQNVGAGEEVYTITATDNNYLIIDHYTIGGTDEGDFTVNASTGVVTLTADPEYETKSSYSFTVTASDAAGNSSAATAVSLSINDLDEVAPLITSDTTTSIDGNSGSGQEIYTITATDDVGVTSYDIGGTDEGDFTVNASTGVVTLTDNPDYAIKSSYSFEVMATDTAGNVSEISDPIMIQLTTLNVDTIVEEELFYTNPVTNTLELVSESPINGVSLYSLSGQKVLEVSPEHSKVMLDISSLATGLYVMKVTTQTNVKTVKLVKE